MEQCKLILDKENKQRRMVGPGSSRDAREYVLEVIRYGAMRSNIGLEECQLCLLKLVILLASR